MTSSSLCQILDVVTYKTQRTGMGWTTAGMPDGEIGGWMDSRMKNTKKILEGKIQGRQPAEKP